MCVPSGRDRSSGVPCAARLHPDCATAVSVGSVQSATSPCYTEIRQFAPLRAGRWRCAVLLCEPRLCGYHGAHCPDQTAQRDTHAVRPRPRVVPCGVPCRAACGGPLRGRCAFSAAPTHPQDRHGTCCIDRTARCTRRAHGRASSLCRGPCPHACFGGSSKLFSPFASDFRVAERLAAALKCVGRGLIMEACSRAPCRTRRVRAPPLPAVLRGVRCMQFWSDSFRSGPEACERAQERYSPRDHCARLGCEQSAQVRSRWFSRSLEDVGEEGKC